MQSLTQKNWWVGVVIRMLGSQKAQVSILQNVHASLFARLGAVGRWVVQGIVLFLASPFIILFATPVNAFPLIARQRLEGTWTYSFSEFSDFQRRARILFLLSLLVLLGIEIYLYFR